MTNVWCNNIMHGNRHSDCEIKQWILMKQSRTRLLICLIGWMVAPPKGKSLCLSPEPGPYVIQELHVKYVIILRILREAYFLLCGCILNPMTIVVRIRQRQMWPRGWDWRDKVTNQETPVATRIWKNRISPRASWGSITQAASEFQTSGVQVINFCYRTLSSQ